MFLSWNNTTQIKQFIAKNEESSRRFADKLAAITEINNMISDTVEKTQNANRVLLNKLKVHLKNGTKTFVSLSEKLNLGVFILNYKGEIIQSNPKAREILGCNNECSGNHIFNLISSIKPIAPPGKAFVLSPTFFQELSTCVFNSLECGATKCLEKLPCSLQNDVEQLVQVNDGDQYMKLTFSVLDNNPDELSDISYVVIFKPSKKWVKSPSPLVSKNRSNHVDLDQQTLHSHQTS